MDVVTREYPYPLTLHVQESGPMVLQTVHPLYHTIQALAKVAGGCATLLFPTLDLYLTSYCAHPTGGALITHFSVAYLATATPTCTSAPTATSKSSKKSLTRCTPTSS